MASQVHITAMVHVSALAGHAADRHTVGDQPRMPRRAQWAALVLAEVRSWVMDGIPMLRARRRQRTPG